MSKPKILGEDYLTKQDANQHRETYNTLLQADKLEQCYLNNFLYNFPILKNYPGILGFEGAFKNMPIVIVGSGPSLEKNMDLLVEHRKKMIVIAGDAALPILVKKLKIYPDLVVMGDPTEKQVYNFEDIDTTKFYTACSSVTHPKMFRKIDPSHLCVYNIKSSSPLLEMIPYHIGRKGGLAAGVLTSGSVFGFAAMTGANPITFIGHDLSWPTPDKVYAKGVVEKKHNFQKNSKFKSDCLLFPDINGELVLTHSTFINFYIWMRDALPRVKTRVFNSSEAGILKMKKIQATPFKNWISRFCKYELVGLEERIHKAYNYQHEDGLVEKLLLPPLEEQK